MNEQNGNGIFEDASKANLEKLVGKIMTLAAQNNYYEFVPGFYLVDNAYLIEFQKKSPDNPLVINKDFTKAPFWIIQQGIKPCDSQGLDIAEVILMTEGMGTEAEG
jgi:hypothetical protein